MKVEQKTIYVTADGYRFDTEKEALEHEKNLEDVYYFCITHDPDLTEGRGYQSKLYLSIDASNGIQVHSRKDVSFLVEDYCYRIFGNSIDYIQGVDPMKAWFITNTNIESFIDPEYPKVGSTQGKVKKKHLKITPTMDIYDLNEEKYVT